MSTSRSKQRRHIELDGQSNFRDLGGYEAADGRTIKWGAVYRSGRLTKLSDEDVARLEALGIRTVVNLLTEDDVELYGRDRVPEGVQEISLPIDSETATKLANRASAALKSGDFSQIPPELNPEIHRLLVHDGQAQYGELLRLIADPAQRPLLFHCSHGVHRTGTGAAILLTALGVPWETVREDYLLSNIYREAEVQQRLGQLRAMAAEKQGVDPEAVDMANMEAFMVQDGSYIDATLDEVEQAYGSFAGYMDALRIATADLQEALLIDG